MKNQPKHPKVTKAHLIFLREIASGSTQRQALLKAYPERRGWKPESLDVTAANLFAKPHLQKAYQDLISKLRKEEEEKARWNREQSIKTLRAVIEANETDMIRIQKGRQEELAQLEEEIDKADPITAKALMKAYIKKQQEISVYKTHNEGIIAAVAELNRMQGYNEANINLNNTVIFQGEEELED